MNEFPNLKLAAVEVPYIGNIFLCKYTYAVNFTVQDIRGYQLGGMLIPGTALLLWGF